MLNGMEFVANTKQICYNRECEIGRERCALNFAMKLRRQIAPLSAL